MVYLHAYNTINIWEKFSSTPIANYEEPNRRMLLNILASNVDQLVDSIVFNEQKANKWQNSSWGHAVDILNQNRHLHDYPHLNIDFVNPPNIHIHTPLHDVSTSSYKHVKVLLEWLYRNKICIEGFKLIVLFCDEQLLCRIWHLLGLGEMWGEIIPFPGDLHFNMHTGLGIMRAGEEYLLLIAELLGYKYIKVDFELDHWSHHDSFLLMVAEAAVQWLYSLLPKSHDGRHMPFEEIVQHVTPNKNISFFYNVYLFYVFDL